MLEIEKKVVYSILPLNKWTDRIDEPRVGIVLKVFCKLQIKGLARVVGYSRVFSE